MERRSPEEIEKERRARFLLVANRRAQKAIAALRQLARCGNRALYSYTPAEGEKLEDTLAVELAAVSDAFAVPAPPKETAPLFE